LNFAIEILIEADNEIAFEIVIEPLFNYSFPLISAGFL
jgi:hypothetical protein